MHYCDVSKQHTIEITKFLTGLTIKIISTTLYVYLWNTIDVFVGNFFKNLHYCLDIRKLTVPCILRDFVGVSVLSARSCVHIQT